MKIKIDKDYECFEHEDDLIIILTDPIKIKYIHNPFYARVEGEDLKAYTPVEYIRLGGMNVLIIREFTPRDKKDAFEGFSKEPQEKVTSENEELIFEYKNNYNHSTAFKKFENDLIDILGKYNLKIYKNEGSRISICDKKRGKVCGWIDYGIDGTYEKHDFSFLDK